MYGCREDLLLSCHGFWLFSDQLIAGGDGGGPCTALSLGLRSGGLESKFGRGPRPLDRRVVSWSCLCLGVGVWEPGGPQPTSEFVLHVPNPGW